MSYLQEYGVVVYFILPALLLAAAATAWLIVNAFRVNALWGLAVLLFPPAALIFVPLNWKAARFPTALFLFACVIGATGFVMGQFTGVSRDPRVKIVDGEKHIVYVHVEENKYKLADLLKQHPDVAVLEAAESKEIDDDFLAVIAALSRLRELNLNHTAVTDAGLARLEKATNLEVLRLNFTKITDEGFQKHVAPLPKLKEVNVRQTEVKGATARKWVADGKKDGIERKQTSGK